MSDQVKVSIQIFPGFKKQILEACRKKGFDPKPTKKTFWITFVCPGKDAALLLTDLRYDFPIGYVQGWTEPV
jgi:hypothetical protein